jgi:hypothetical protein
LINIALLTGNFFPQVAHAENAIKRFCVARIEGAQHELAVGQVSEAARELAAIRIEVIQEFRRAFILAHTNVSVVGCYRQDAIVANLMNVLG